MAVIFLAEDDAGVRDGLAELLGRYGYECRTSEDYAHLVDAILRENPDLVLLDLGLPGCDGYSVCRELRRRSRVPVVVVTSRDSEADELLSMSFGADDFVAKPFHAQILLAHIAAVLKRANPSAPQTLSHRGLELDPAKGEARCRGRAAELTKNELRILHLLMSSPGRVVSRGELMEALWQTDEFVDENTLTVNVNRLRRKLESLGLRDYLKTKRGRGYLV